MLSRIQTAVKMAASGFYRNGVFMLPDLFAAVGDKINGDGGKLATDGGNMAGVPGKRKLRYGSLGVRRYPVSWGTPIFKRKIHGVAVPERFIRIFRKPFRVIRKVTGLG